MSQTTETPQAPQKPNWWRRVLFTYRWMSLRNKIALWSLVSVLVIVAVSFQWIKPAFRSAKMWYFIRLGESLVEKKDYGAASLAYRKVMLSGYERPESWKSLAKFLEQAGSPEIITVWEKLAALEPEVREHRYKQISASIQFDRSYEAEQILNKLPESWRNDREYLRGIADVAIQKNQLPVAEQALGRILEIDPKDEKALYDLVFARANSPDQEVRRQALQKLAEIGNGTTQFAAPALRKLIDLAADQKDFVESDRLATKLIALPDAVVGDRLRHLQFELMTQSLTAQISMGKLREYAQTHPDAFEPIIQWFIANKVDETGTADWIKSLSPETTAQPMVKSGLLRYYLSVADFPAVFRNLRERAKSLNIPPRVLDLAENAITQVSDDYATSDRTWMQAIYASERNPQALYYLSLVASARGWTSATGRALTALAESNPSQPGVWNLLAKHESTAGNLPGYYKALTGLMQINPYDIHVASDWVIASILLRKGETPEILDVAKRTYDATEPADPWAGTAYAMALLADKRPQAAREVMMRMSEPNRLLPQRAVYVGAVFAACGDNEEALEFFRRAEGFRQNNFSEEQMLLRIWKGVAMGEATTAEEQEKILASRKNLEKEAAAVEADLQAQLVKRADPAEVQRIFENLKAESQSRKAVPVEVQQLIQQIRSEQSAPKKPATP